MRAGVASAVYPDGKFRVSERKAGGTKLEREPCGHDFSRRNDKGYEEGWPGERDARGERADFRFAHRDDGTGRKRTSSFHSFGTCCLTAAANPQNGRGDDLTILPKPWQRPFCRVERLS